MKRRSEISIPILPTSSSTGFNGLRSNPHFRDAVRESSVKFSETEVCPSLHNDPPFSSEQHGAAEPRRSSDAPKTSEYAFFKKLKADAGCSRSSLLPGEGAQLKTFEPSGITKAYTTKFKDNFQKIKSSIHLEEARVISHNIFSPPQAIAPEVLEAAQVVENFHNDIRSPFLAKTVNFSNQNLLLSPLSDALGETGDEDVDRDMFSQKRKRLRQWVAETSVPEVENLNWKGYDLVSVLLNRLLPDRDQGKHCRDTEATPLRTDTKCSTAEYHHEDKYGENIRTCRTRDFTEADPLSYLGDFCNKSSNIIPLKLDSSLLNSPSTSQCLRDNFFLEDNYNETSLWMKRRDRIGADPVWYLDDNINRTKDMIPFNLDTIISNSPSVRRAHFQYGTHKSYLSCNHRSKSNLSLRDPYVSSDLEVYESSSLNQIERNEFLALNESDCERERGSDTMLLGWNFSNSQDEGDLSHTTCGKEMTLFSNLAAPWYDRHLRLGNSLEVRESPSSSPDSHCHSEITLYPYSYSENHSNRDSRFTEEDSLFVAGLKQYPLPLPYVSKSIDMSEVGNTYSSYEADDGISLQRNDWVIGNIFTENSHSDLEPLLLYGNDRDTYGKCSSSRELQFPQKESIYSFLLTGEHDNFLNSSKDRQSGRFYTEDTINIHKWLSIDLHMPFQKEMVCPFMLESSSICLASEECNYNEDS